MKEFRGRTGLQRRSWTRALGLMLALCMALGGAAAQDAGVPALIDVPEQVTEPDVTIRFSGERGVSYTLHYKYRNIWLLPTTVQLTGPEGEFRVSLGEGANDFVLVESNLPRESDAGIPFTIDYVTQPVTLAVTATVAPTAVATR
ncbi:hypothetical protein LJC74_09515, partial [Eubacteriales bacterium OttesenSCG-928-A19]|nr:hypothetical protein [Eubacteriales bacterium OttesenSCG-928-A19]